MLYRDDARRRAQRVAVPDVRLCVQQRTRYRQVATQHGPHQGRLLVVGHRVDLGILGERELDEVLVAEQRGPMQQGVAFVVRIQPMLRILFQHTFQRGEILLPNHSEHRLGPLSTQLGFHLRLARTLRCDNLRLRGGRRLRRRGLAACGQRPVGAGGRLLCAAACLALRALGGLGLVVCGLSGAVDDVGGAFVNLRHGEAPEKISQGSSFL
mmetsp:Transcript_59659/g.155132  ORF Transcript_59659/g.155132 Transcript_59659/m.155132 type:complete len:211 (+) Transcript_59659:1421-2053(+)